VPRDGELVACDADGKPPNVARDCVIVKLPR
jgi:hypothetical protein